MDKIKIKLPLIGKNLRPFIKKINTLYKSLDYDARFIQLAGEINTNMPNPVLNLVSMHLNKGEVIGLLGPNGAGKTTTFYMITGMIRVTSGAILLELLMFPVQGFVGEFVSKTSSPHLLKIIIL